MADEVFGPEDPRRRKGTYSSDERMKKTRRKRMEVVTVIQRKPSTRFIGGIVSTEGRLVETMRIRKNERSSIGKRLRTLYPTQIHLEFSKKEKRED